MIGAAILLEIIAFAVTPKDAVSLYTSALSGGSKFAVVGILTALGGIVAVANGIWGFVEGIIILSQGDAGLASKGYNVAAPVQGYGQPMNNYNQMPQQNYYGQPMPVQPMPAQPTPQQDYTNQPLQSAQSNMPDNTPDMNQNNMPQENNNNMGAENNGQQ